VCLSCCGSDFKSSTTDGSISLICSTTSGSMSWLCSTTDGSVSSLLVASTI
jgi:hypothetical protein